jgi:hypothetical protein
VHEDELDDTAILKDVLEKRERGPSAAFVEFVAASQFGERGSRGMAV